MFSKKPAWQAGDHSTMVFSIVVEALYRLLAEKTAAVFQTAASERFLPMNEVLGKMWIATEFEAFFRPTIQPTTCDVLYDFRVFWQSPRSCKLL